MANLNHVLLSAAATVNATRIDRTGTVERVIGYTAAAAARYLKLYDKATAPAETDTPVLVLYLPPTTPFSLSIGLRFEKGIAYRMTTGSADNDTGALTAGDVVGLNLLYT